MMVAFAHRVRYHEVDQQGYLFNGKYFEIADVAHTELIRELGWTYPELNALGADPSVIHIKADFSAPARFDDQLQVKTRCIRVGRSSFDVETRVLRDDALVATITITYVNVDAAAGEARPLPEQFAHALRMGMDHQSSESLP